MSMGEVLSRLVVIGEFSGAGIAPWNSEMNSSGYAGETDIEFRDLGPRTG
jgi:hypothetical protein